MERKASSFMTTLGDLPYILAKKYPRKLGIIGEDIRLTWQEANNRINSLSNAFIALGLKKGDRCAILDHGSHRYIELYLAMAKAGVIAVPLNPRLAPKELAYMINDSGAKGICIESIFSETINPIKNACKTLEVFIGMGQDHRWPLDYKELIANYPNSEPIVPIGETDIFRIVYTGGTTGFPKGVMLSHKSTMAHVMSMHLSHRGVPSDIFGCFAGLPLLGNPLIVFSFMLLGGTIVIDTFSPKRFYEVIDKEKITITMLTPTMIIMVLEGADHTKYDLSSLRQFQYGASPMPVPILQKLINIFPNSEFLQVYGATEGGLTIAILPPEDHRIDKESEKASKVLSSIGKAFDNVEIAVIDDNGNELPAGEIGEVVSRGPLAMDGYWNNPEGTAEAFKFGWCHVGDLGYKDENGYIYLVDRKKDMIITGGFNVYSKEVENAIYGHPAVEEVAVIGVPDPKWGEAVKALIKLKKGKIASTEEILEVCHENIARFKVPKSIEFVEDFPHTALGKIQKSILREVYWKGHDRRIYGGGDRIKESAEKE